MTQDIRYRLAVDGAPQTAAGFAQVDKAVAALGNSAPAASAQLAKSAAQITSLGVSARQTAAAMRTLPAQFTDIATQLAGGQNPFLVLLQQGGQIKDSFGGVGNAVRALGTVLTPVRLLVGGTAASVALLAKAAIDGSSEISKLNRTLAITGNAAGLTIDRYEQLADSISSSTKASIGSTRDLLQELIASGRLSGSALSETAEAAQRLAVATGESATEIARKFIGLTDDAARGAAALNKQYNFLTVEQFKLVQQLQQQGRVQEAVALTMRTLSQQVGDQTTNLGYLDRAWQGLGRSVSAVWDFLKGIGREDGIGAQAAALQRQIDRLETQRDALPAGLRGGNSGIDAEIAKLRQKQSLLQSEVRLQNQAADAQAKRAADNQKQIDALLKSASSAASVRDVFGDLLRDIDRVTAANQARLAAGGELSRAQELERSLNDKLADSLSKLNPRQREAVQAAIARAVASQDALDVQARELKAAQAAAKERADLRRQEEADIEAFLAKQRDAAQQQLDDVNNRAQALQTEEAAAALAARGNISLAQAVEEVAIARLREQQARLNPDSEEGRAAIALIEREIQARLKLATLIAGKAVRDANEQAAREAAEAWQRAFDGLSQSLADAIIRGGKSAKQLLIDLFKTPLALAVARPLTAPLAAALATPASAAAAGGLGGSAQAVGGIVQAFVTLPQLISRGISGGFEQLATSALGQRFGLSTLAEDAAGNLFAAPTAAAGQFANALGTAGAALAAFSVGSGIGRSISSGYSLNGGSGNSAINAGAIAGTLLGGPIGTAIGAIVGGAVNRLFGRKLTDVGISGTLGGPEGFSGSSFQQFSGGLFRSDKTVTGPVDAQLAAALSTGANTLRSAAAGYARVLGLPAEAIDSYTEQIRVSLQGLDAQQAQAKIAETLAGFGTALVQPLSAALLPFARTGEDAAGTLRRLGDALAGVNAVLPQINQRLLETSVAGGDAASKLADLFGGTQALAQQSGAYFDRYFSDAEKVARATQDVGAALAAVGLVMPDSRDAFRALVEAQDLSTDAGREAFRALLGVADAFDYVQRSADEAAKASEDAAAAAAAAAQALAKELQAAIDAALPKFQTADQRTASSYAGIAGQLQAAGLFGGTPDLAAVLSGATKQQIFEFAEAFVRAAGNSVEAKIAVVEAASALADLKDSAADAARQLQADGLQRQLEDIARVFGDVSVAAEPVERLSDAYLRNRDALGELQRGLDELTGGAARTVQQTLADMLASQRALQAFAGQLDDAIGEARLAALDPSARVQALRAQESQLFAGLSGATDPVAAAQRLQAVVLRRIQEEAVLRQQAQQADIEAARAQAQLAKAARDEQIAALRDQISAAERLRSLSQDIAQFTGSLRFSDLSPLSPTGQLSAARGLFDTTLSAAQAGDEFAQRNLTVNARAYLEEARSYFASGSAYAQIFGQVTRSLDALGAAGAAADPQVAALQDQLDALQALNQTQQDVADAVVDTSADTVAGLLQVREAVEALIGANEEPIARQLELARQQIEQLAAVVDNQRAQIVQQAAIAEQLTQQLERLNDSLDDQSLLAGAAP